MYPEYNQLDPGSPKCSEDTAYPAAPDSEYGWEKLFSERFYLAANRNYGLDIRIARLHNIYGPAGSWNDGREKAPAALCRKISETPDGGEIEMWGDGKQTRSFMYIDDCIKGTQMLIHSDISEPINIGSAEMVTINELVDIVEEIADLRLVRKYNLDAPKGVRGRSSDNTLIERLFNWSPNISLIEGMEKTYQWIYDQIEK